MYIRQREQPFQRHHTKNTWNVWRNLVCWSRGRLAKKSEVTQKSYIAECCAHGEGFFCRVKAITIVRLRRNEKIDLPKLLRRNYRGMQSRTEDN